MTPAQLAVIEDALRSTPLTDAQVRRALFAIRPRRVNGEVCAICDADLSMRPVLTTVRHRDTTINKRVHMKPVQVVLASRREGAHGPRDFDPPAVFWRFCAKCALAMLEPLTGKR